MMDSRRETEEMYRADPVGGRQFLVRLELGMANKLFGGNGIPALFFGQIHRLVGLVNQPVHIDHVALLGLVECASDTQGNRN